LNHPLFKHNVGKFVDIFQCCLRPFTVLYSGEVSIFGSFRYEEEAVTLESFLSFDAFYLLKVDESNRAACD